MIRRASYLIVLVLCFSFVLAQPPFQTSEAPDGYKIEVPMIQYHKLNESLVVSAHLYNATSGFLLTNESGACYVYLYSSNNGSLLVEEQMIFDDNDVDFNLEIGGGNFSSVGQYSVSIWCFYPPEEVGDYANYPLYINWEGQELTKERTNAEIVLLGFFMAIFSGYFYLNRKINFEGWYNSMLSRYENKNYFKMTLSMIGFNIIKDRLLMFYLLGFPVILLFTDLVLIHNIDAIYDLSVSILWGYTWFSIIVAFSFIGKVQEFVKNVIDDFEKQKWGMIS